MSVTLKIPYILAVLTEKIEDKVYQMRTMLIRQPDYLFFSM